MPEPEIMPHYICAQCVWKPEGVDGGVMLLNSARNYQRLWREVIGFALVYKDGLKCVDAWPQASIVTITYGDEKSFRIFVPGILCPVQTGGRQGFYTECAAISALEQKLQDADGILHVFSALNSIARRFPDEREYLPVRLVKPCELGPQAEVGPPIFHPNRQE